MTGILKHSDAIKFILAGNSTFTCLNTKTSNRFTYKVKLSKTSTPENPLFFVKVLTNPETYQFIGSIFKDRFKYSQKSKISNEAQSVIVFQYILSKLLLGKLDSCVEIYHEGKCGKLDSMCKILFFRKDRISKISYLFDTVVVLIILLKYLVTTCDPTLLISIALTKLNSSSLL